MPVFNAADYLGPAIDSILAQTFEHFELIIINDGSTDCSLNIAEQYQSRDKRIIVHAQTNKGPGAARNFGLKVARGKYIYFMDSDDLLVPETFAVCVEHVDNHNLDLLAFSGTVLGEISDVIKPEYYLKPDILTPCTGSNLLSALVNQNAYSCSPCLYIFSRELLHKMGSWFDEGFIHEDEGFTSELYCHASRSIALSRRLFKRRVRSGSIMTRPISWDNIEGVVQAAARIELFLTGMRDVKRKLRISLRQIQKAILRKGRRIAEFTDNTIRFRILLSERWTKGKLTAIDPLMTLYIHANPLYRGLRHFWRYTKPQILD